MTKIVAPRVVEHRNFIIVVLPFDYSNSFFFVFFGISILIVQCEEVYVVQLYLYQRSHSPTEVRSGRGTHAFYVA